MNIYYCNECASRNGHVSIVDTETLNLTGSDYLFDKFEKHTQLPIGSGFTSIFDGSTYSDYLNYSLSALDNGALEIDSQNRKNLIWFAGEDIGIAYQSGSPVCANDAVKIVFPEDSNKLHSFPVDSQPYATSVCQDCGAQIQL